MNNIIYNNTPKFTGRNVPIDEIASAIGKSSVFVREALKRGVLTFGIVMKNEDSSHYNFYCPDKKVWEETGYFNENPGGDS